MVNFFMFTRGPVVPVGGFGVLTISDGVCVDVHACTQDNLVILAHAHKAIVLCLEL